MEFNEKLQNLRKQKGLTQEELAEVLFVSRTAVSKWESGRGYPNIDSLKLIANYFSVTIDELLTGSEVLDLAEQEGLQKAQKLQSIVFGLLDISVVLFLFLPLFAQISDDTIRSVSLLHLTKISLWLKIIYFIFTITSVILGVLTLLFQYCNLTFGKNYKSQISFILSTVGVLLFIVSSQVYATAFLFFLLVIKIAVLTKKL